MKSVLNVHDWQILRQRILNFSESNKRKCGQMTHDQMLCHCADQIRLALGRKAATEKATWFNEFIVLPVAMILPQLPRLKLRAPNDMSQSAGGLGSKPVSFEVDKTSLLEVAEYFHHSATDFKPHPHPSYGKLNRRQWGRFIFLHLDYHLRQFSA
jgi:hypothetical protein